MSQSANELPLPVRRFLYSCIDSIEQLDTLLHLSASDKAATVRHVSSQLGLQPEAVRMHLEALVARGLLQVRVGEPSHYRYEPRTAELRGYVDALVEHHRRDRSAIVTFVAAQSRGAIKRFADAFKWTGEP